MDRYHGLPVDGAHPELALASIAGLHRKPFDAQLLLQQIPPRYFVASPIAFAQAFDVDPHCCPNKLDRLDRVGLQRQVEVDAYQAEGKHRVAKSRDAVNEEIIEESTVGGNEEYVPACITAPDHVIKATWQMQSEFARHERMLLEIRSYAICQA